MKRIILIIVAVVLLLSAALVIFNWSAALVKFNRDKSQLKNDLDRYNRILDKDLPEDLTLTIYWVWGTIDTTTPISIENLVSIGYGIHQKTFVISSEEIAEHLGSMKQLNSSTIQASNAEHYVDARLYYVLETRGTQILTVSLNNYCSDDENASVYLNGIKIKPNPALFEAIRPFLPEEDREILDRKIEEDSH